jgi:ribosomal protein L3 glutamine methyltransferase
LPSAASAKADCSSDTAPTTPGTKRFICCCTACTCHSIGSSLFSTQGLTSDERTAVLRIIERRISERLPAAYLTNEAWLAEYRFYVDQRVIVPRSFIAELLREQLAPWIDDPESVASVLDLCTGSGCLAIFAAHAFPAARVDAIDISPDALAVAERNVSDYELTARIRLLESNLFAALDKERYDLIISNPPYVNAHRCAACPPNTSASPPWRWPAVRTDST